MKSRKWTYIAIIGLLIFAVLLIVKPFKSDRTLPDNSGDTPNQQSAIGDNDLPDTTDPEKVDPSRDDTVQLQIVALDAPPEVIDTVEMPAFKTAGSATKGVIRNKDGDVIRWASSESPAFSVNVSPDEKLMWVNGGDRRSYIINAQGVDVADLPIVPPGKDMLGFSKWLWIDNNRLIGESGVQKYDETGKLIACCAGDNVSESRFYIYDLTSKKMIELQLPEELKGKAISIQNLQKSGEFELVHEDKDFGWHKIRPKS